MKVRDLLKMEIDVDVVDDVTEDLYIAFVGPQELTREGEKEFALVLDLEVEHDANSDLYIIHVDDDDERTWKRRLRSAVKLFNGMAGYCSVENYELWFKEQSDAGYMPPTDDETQPIKLIANQLLRDRFPSYWGVFGSDFYNDVVENVKESTDWPHWNSNDVSLAVQRIIIWSMRKGVTEG